MKLLAHAVVVLALAVGLGVTQEPYERVMGVNPSISRDHSIRWKTVSWDDAIEFCDGCLSCRRRRRQAVLPPAD